MRRKEQIARPRRLTWRSGSTLVMLLSIMSLLRTDRSVDAALPGALAGLVPTAPLVFLETDDFPRLIGRWRDCRLRRDVEATETYQRCLSSRLLLRLGQRLDRLETALAAPLTLDRLSSLPGDQGGVALYNVGDLSFVLWLRLRPGAVDEFEVLRRGLPVERSQRSGQRFVVHRGSDETSPIAFAVVGQLLIVSNDTANFQRALALAVDNEGDALAADETYVAMTRRAPADAQVHLYLDMARLVSTRPFQRYWVHGNSEDLRGLDRTLLSLKIEEHHAVERRVLSYRAGEAPRLPAGSIVGVSADERLEALPGGTYAAVRGVDAEEAARAARWIWPRAADGSERLEPLRDLLVRGRVTHVVEVIRPFLDRNWFFPHDRLAIAFALESPEALSTRDAVDAASSAFSKSIIDSGSITTRARRSTKGGVTTHTLTSLLPGGSNLSVSRARGDGVLVLATDIDLAVELAGAAAPTAPLGQALAAGGPDAARLDYARANRALSKRLDLITNASENRRIGATAFLGEEVPELLGVPIFTRVERIAVRDGDFDRHEVRYFY